MEELDRVNVDTYKKKRLTIGRFGAKEKEIRILLITLYVTRPTKPIDVDVVQIIPSPAVSVNLRFYTQSAAVFTRVRFKIVT